MSDTQPATTEPPADQLGTVFQAIETLGHDWDWEPDPEAPDFAPTASPIGSPAKVEVLAERVRRGLPLWHPRDEQSADATTPLRTAGGGVRRRPSRARRAEA